MSKNTDATASFMDQAWMITSTKNMGGANCMVTVEAMLNLYLIARMEGKVKRGDVLADIHYLTGGVPDAFDWLYGQIAHMEPDRAALEIRYASFAEGNPDSVGPLFPHYFMEFVQREKLPMSYAKFCSSRKIGQVYPEPILMNADTSSAAVVICH